MVEDQISHLFAPIIESVSDLVVITTADMDGRNGPVIVYANPAFYRKTGYAEAEVIGKSPRILEGAGTDAATKATIRAALERRKSVRAQLLNYTKMGAEYWVDLQILPLRDAAGEVTHFASIERDITEQKSLEARLTEYATVDELTGAFNRRYLFEAGAAECVRGSRHQRSFSLLMLDLDDFKDVNDTLGHSTGDEILRCFVRTCRAQLRASDTLGRIGGEEFAIVAPETPIEGGRQVAERIRADCEAARLLVDGQPVRITVSIGVAEFEGSEDDFAAVMKRGDRALYRAKRSGRNRVEVEGTRTSTDEASSSAA
jgi:diguanylate cyclase (GGDEF)-like protein/PAS domain S-box-containing protein